MVYSPWIYQSWEWVHRRFLPAPVPNLFRRPTNRPMGPQVFRPWAGTC